MLPAIPFYMIRHGESTANLSEIASGHIDVELTERGIAQAYEAQKVVEALRTKPKLIIHSHLQRARNTARILNENLGLPMIEDPMIAEQHYGDWEGQSWSITRQPTRDGVNPPNGETHADFYARVQTAITRFTQNNEGPVMIVCHGGVFRAFGGLYGQTIHGIQNCSLHYFEPTHDIKDGSLPWNIQTFPPQND